MPGDRRQEDKETQLTTTERVKILRWRIALKLEMLTILNSLVFKLGKSQEFSSNGGKEANASEVNVNFYQPF